MKVHSFVSGFVAGGIVFGLAAVNFAPQDPAEMEKMMQEAMEKYMTPAEQHAELAELAGTYNADLKMWPAPGAPYETMTGTSQLEMVMDGRYLVEHFKSEYMGMPFEGAGMTAYDRMKGEYQSIWIDNMATGIAFSTGKKKGDKMVFEGEMPDAMLGKYVPMRTVQTSEDENSFIVSMYRPGPDGKDFKTMEITYTRSE